MQYESFTTSIATHDDPPHLQLDLQAPPSEGFTAVFGPLDLASAQVLAKGADRYVFQHPHEPSLLVKVINMEAYAAYLERKPLKRFY